MLIVEQRAGQFTLLILSHYQSLIIFRSRNLEKCSAKIAIGHEFPPSQSPFAQRTKSLHRWMKLFIGIESKFVLGSASLGSGLRRPAIL